MWLNKVIYMGGTNQLGTNTCHHNKKLNQILNHLHLFWDFPKSLINEYSDIWANGNLSQKTREESLMQRVRQPKIDVWCVHNLDQTSNQPKNDSCMGSRATPNGSWSFDIVLISIESSEQHTLHTRKLKCIMFEEETHVMIHSKTPMADRMKETSANGSPIRNPSGLQFSQHILPTHFASKRSSNPDNNLLQQLLALLHTHTHTLSLSPHAQIGANWNVFTQF